MRKRMTKRKRKGGDKNNWRPSDKNNWRMMAGLSSKSDRFYPC